MVVIVMINAAAMRMDNPSTNPKGPLAIAPQIPERTAEPPTTHQSLSEAVCLSEASSVGVFGNGLVLYPNLN